MRKTRDPKAQRAALALLARGLGTPGEISELAGVSRQLVESWARAAGIDWRKVKRSKLIAAWSIELAQERAPMRRSKSSMRRIAEKAKADMDRSNGPRLVKGAAKITHR